MGKRKQSGNPFPGLEDLEAYLSSFEKRPEVALQELAERFDPSSMRRKISLMLELNKTDEAAALVKSAKRDARWCDVAVAALVLNDEVDEAVEMVEWAGSQNNSAICERTALIFSYEIHKKFQAGVVAKSDLRTAIRLLTPVLTLVQQRGRASNRLESNIVEIAFHILQSLEESEMVYRLAPILELQRPLPLTLALAALAGWVEPAEDLTQRLREEHPDSVEAQIIAAAADAQLFDKPHDALEAALELRDKVATPQDKEELARLLHSLAASQDDNVMAKVREASQSLEFSDQAFEASMEAYRLLQEDESKKAGEILESHRDETDPLWLQIYSNYLLQIGEREGAVNYLQKAVDIVPHPDLLRKAASLAYETGRLTETAVDLERLLVRRPKDVFARRGLAAAYWDSQQYEKAVTQFDLLIEMEPNVDSYRQSKASCYFLMGDVERALEVTKDLFRDHKPELSAVLQRSQIHRVMGRSKEAFRLLSDFRSEYWSSPDFLKSYLELAYEAEEEAAAHDAMMRLLYLQDEGLLEDEVLQRKSLEDVKQMMLAFNDRKRHLYGMLLRNRCPWLLSDHLLGHSPFWSWSIRTQPLRWISEDINTRAAFAVYSTNGFTVDGRIGNTRLVPIVCPPPGQGVVADLSALITIYRLGIVDQAVSFFGKLYLPSVYLAQALQERVRLLHHQPSRGSSARAIKQAVDSSRLEIIDNSESTELLRINEYSDEPFYKTAALSIRDVLELLYEAGELSSQQMKGALAKNLREPIRKPANICVKRGDMVVVDVDTLRTFFEDGLLDAFLEFFRGRITRQQHDAVISEIGVVRLGEDLWKAHKELWDELRKHPEVVILPDSAPKLVSGETDADIDAHLAAIRFAEARKLPIFADDRVLQAQRLNEELASPCNAFGTDALVSALWENDLITLRKTADLYLSLMKWRYRFIIVPYEILLEYAIRYEDHPPGRDLRRVAEYLHDSMCDPGLLDGPEPQTDPPISMSHKYFQEWTAVITRFVIELWYDDRFSEGSRRQIADWCCSELFPCLPFVLGFRGAPLVDSFKYYVMGTALVATFKSEDRESSNRALVTLGRGLGLDDEAYLHVVLRVLHNHGKSN